MNKKILDASFLVSAIRTCDANHLSCCSYLANEPDPMWVIPTIAFFEYQAAQSRLSREGKGEHRGVYLPRHELFHIDARLIRESVHRNLPNVFQELKGADLIYACIAEIENLPLVTCDRHFEKYKDKISIINPCDNETTFS